VIQKTKLEPWQSKNKYLFKDYRTWTYLSGGDEKQAATDLSNSTTIRGEQNLPK
jgi:hypothetical protein